MSVVADLKLDPAAFGPGRVLDVGPGCTVELCRSVPLGARVAPRVRVYDHGGDDLAARVRAHSAVEAVRVVHRGSDSVLLAVDWDLEDDAVFGAIRAEDGELLGAVGTGVEWKLELRFPHHRELSRFRERCSDAGISMEVVRVSTPTSGDDGPCHGLSRPQREALVAAVDRGYYEIPRQTSTQELAEELGISDQATTERLRRGIDELVRSALVDAGKRRGESEPTTDR